MNFCPAHQACRAAALLASVLTLANSPSAATHAGPRHQIAQRGGSSPATHLYEAVGGSVVSYPLAADGLPATTPDWRLNGGLRKAWAIAFDGAGNLYVSDSGRNQIRVYGPGASADDLPVRIIPLPGPGCAVAVNKAGYVFATYNIGLACSPTVSIYAPVVGPLPETWVPQPIHTITITKYPFLLDLITDSRGRLYVAPITTDIYVYNDPVNEWQYPNEDLVTKRGEGDILEPIAIGEDDRDIYMQLQRDRPQGWGGGDHAKRSLTTKRPDLVSLTRECNGDGQYGLEYSLAVSQNYLMFTCMFSPGLLVYHNLPGRQDLVEALPSGVGLLLWP
jgi:hypothetical protein